MHKKSIGVGTTTLTIIIFIHIFTHHMLSRL